MIAKIYHDQVKEKTIQLAHNKSPLNYKGQYIKDLIADESKDRKEFDGVRQIWREAGIQHGFLFPARLILTHRGATEMFDSPQEAGTYVSIKDRPHLSRNTVWLLVTVVWLYWSKWQVKYKTACYAIVVLLFWVAVYSFTFKSSYCLALRHCHYDNGRSDLHFLSQTSSHGPQIAHSLCCEVLVLILMLTCTCDKLSNSGFCTAYHLLKSRKECVRMVWNWNWQLVILLLTRFS